MRDNEEEDIKNRKKKWGDEGIRTEEVIEAIHILKEKSSSTWQYNSGDVTKHERKWTWKLDWTVQ